jgi:hypothetical protein
MRAPGELFQDNGGRIDLRGFPDLKRKLFSLANHPGWLQSPKLCGLRRLAALQRREV